MSDQKQLLLKIPLNLHRDFKLKCTANDSNMQSEILKLIQMYVDDEIIKKES